MLAIEMGACARDLAMTMHAHPTLSKRWLKLLNPSLVIQRMPCLRNHRFLSSR